MVDRDLIATAKKMAGGSIHSVSQIANCYLNQRKNADHYDSVKDFSEGANLIRNKAEYFERYLRSFLVTNNLKISYKSVVTAMKNENKFPWPD